MSPSQPQPQIVHKKKQLQAIVAYAVFALYVFAPGAGFNILNSILRTKVQFILDNSQILTIEDKFAMSKASLQAAIVISNVCTAAASIVYIAFLIPIVIFMYRVIYGFRSSRE